MPKTFGLLGHNLSLVAFATYRDSSPRFDNSNARGDARGLKLVGVTGMKNPANILAALGLVVGAVFGLAGTMVAQPNQQAILWAIDSAGLVMACALLALKFFRKEREVVAAGFLVFAIGEGVLLSGTAAGAIGSVPSFGAGTALWATALMLISTPREFPVWVRSFGIVASILFAITAARIFWGEQLLPTASPLPFFAYPILVITFAGWISVLLREKSEDR